MGPDWSPELYLQFAGERTQPAIDLLAQVGVAEARLIYDLGCGPGNSTAVLLERFPEARIIGVDSSPAMLEKAKREAPQADYELADLAHWQPSEAADLMFANATMQWVPDHLRVIKRLLRHLRPGGNLAVQMPDNLDEPSHALMRKVASNPLWVERLRHAMDLRQQLPPAAAYYNALAGDCHLLKIWRTTYHHKLSNHRAILDFVSSTGLRPFMEPLSPDEQQQFKDIYARELRSAYPTLAAGGVLLPFPRLFIVVTT